MWIVSQEVMGETGCPPKGRLLKMSANLSILKPSFRLQSLRLDSGELVPLLTCDHELAQKLLQRTNMYPDKASSKPLAEMSTQWSQELWQTHKWLEASNSDLSTWPVCQVHTQLSAPYWDCEKVGRWARAIFITDLRGTCILSRLLTVVWGG